MTEILSVESPPTSLRRVFWLTFLPRTASSASRATCRTFGGIQQWLDAGVARA
jgi:hypothetical protein